MDSINKSKANKINFGDSYKQKLAVFLMLAAIFSLLLVFLFYRAGSYNSLSIYSLGLNVYQYNLVLFISFSMITILAWNKIFPLINRRYGQHIGNIIILNKDKAVEVHYSNMGYGLYLSDIKESFQYLSEKHPNKPIKMASWILGRARIKQGLIKELENLGYSHYEEVKPLVVEILFKKAAIVIGCLMSFKLKAAFKVVRTPFKSVVVKK
jgi:hypothetical protein